MAAETLSERSKKKISQHIATIKQWPEFETKSYLEDHPEKMDVVVLTLKHYANPLGGYPVDADFEREIQAVLLALADPKLLQYNAFS